MAPHQSSTARERIGLWPRSATVNGATIEQWAVFTVITGFTCVWVLVTGKNVSWDVLNHHVYLPFSLITGRFRSDLFGAGPQSYQNPLGYLPFYALTSAGLPDWLIAVVLALIHEIAVVPIYGLAVQIWGTGADGRFWRLAGTAAAWLSPIFLLYVGTSSIDPLTSATVLWALWGAVRPARTRTGWSSAWVVGALLGLAFALKPSNAVFVLSIGLLLTLRVAVLQETVLQLVMCGLAALIAALVAMGPWSAWLWSRFGNPLFPLFNQYFHSPYAPQEPIVAMRFIPKESLDYVTRLWDLVLLQRNTNTEAFAPDLRPLALGILLVVLIARVSWNSPERWRHRDVWTRPDVQLGVFSVLSYLLWLKTSGNARYAIPLFMVCGLLLVRVGQIALPWRIGHARVASVLLGVILTLQILYYGKDGEHRVEPVPWSGEDYLYTRVPPRLRDEPFLHLSIGTQTSAGVAPALNRGGALINIVGQMSMPTDGPLGELFHQRLHEWQGRTRFMFRSPTPNAPAPNSGLRRGYEALVRRFGLQIDWSDCETIWFQADEKYIASLTARGATILNDMKMPLLSCNAAPGSNVDSQDDSRLTADRAFAIVQKQCPGVFSPAPLVSESPAPGLWQRLYVNTDATVAVSAERGVEVSYPLLRVRYRLGSISDVLEGRGRMPCEAWSSGRRE